MPPAPPVWGTIGLGFVGFAASALVTALLYVLGPCYEAPAAASRLCGGFGCGWLLATLIVGTRYSMGSVQIDTALLAIFPLISFLIYASNGYPAALVGVRPVSDAALRGSLKDLRNIPTVLFSLLLFFQFGNECSLAGWLPLFLIHRLGTSPEWPSSGWQVTFQHCF
jgi:hypothetical protein